MFVLSEAIVNRAIIPQAGTESYCRWGVAETKTRAIIRIAQPKGLNDILKQALVDNEAQPSRQCKKTVKPSRMIARPTLATGCYVSITAITCSVQDRAKQDRNSVLLHSIRTRTTQTSASAKRTSPDLRSALLRLVGNTAKRGC